jgi:nucleolin
MDNKDEVREPAAPNQKLFIGGLAWAATDEDLRAAFAEFGEVVSASVVRYPDTGRSKGFGFVEFATVEEATEAKDKMDGKEIAGRAIKVDFSLPSTGRRDR